MPSVLIPQHPIHRGENGMQRRLLDWSDAERYGPIVELVDLFRKPMEHDSLNELDRAIDVTSPDDWMLCVGSPVMIAAASAAFALKHQRINLLQWQPLTRRYDAVQVFFESDSVTVRNATLGETQ